MNRIFELYVIDKKLEWFKRRKEKMKIEKMVKGLSYLKKKSLRWEGDETGRRGEGSQAGVCACESD